MGALGQGQFVCCSNDEVVAWVLQGGTMSEPFRGRAYAPWGRRFGRAARIIRRSRERWAVARAVVEAKIERWAARRS
jgi:hypothetical protein